MEKLNNPEESALEATELGTVLLISSWLGNENGVKFALEQGQDPQTTDSEGR